LPVHRLVGVLNDLLWIIARNTDAYADAGVYDLLHADWQVEWTGDHVRDAAGDLVSFLIAVHVAAHDKELVATEPRNDVFDAYGVPDPVRNDPQDVVTDEVAVAIVDPLN